MKRSRRITVLSIAFVLVGLACFLGGVLFATEASFPNTISHTSSRAPDVRPGVIYPASVAVLWLLHDTDLFGHHELRYVLHVHSSTGDREYAPITFSVEEVGSVVDASQARFEWNTEEPTLVFQIGDFQHRFDLGEKLSVHSQPKDS